MHTVTINSKFPKKLKLIIEMVSQKSQRLYMKVY